MLMAWKPYILFLFTEVALVLGVGIKQSHYWKKVDIELMQLTWQVLEFIHLIQTALRVLHNT